MAVDSSDPTTSLGSDTFRGCQFTKKKDSCGYVRRRERVNGHWGIENIQSGRVTQVTVSSHCILRRLGCRGSRRA